MSASGPFTGYPGRIWATCWQSMTWLNNLLNGGAVAIDTIDDPTAAVLATLVNAVRNLEAWQTGAVLTIEAQNMAAIGALALPLDTATQTYFDNRLAALSAAATAISALPQEADPFDAVALLVAGSPAIRDPFFLEWCISFSGETSPSGSLPISAIPAAQAWLTIANAIFVLQGANPTSAYDTAARQFRCATVVATTLNQTTSGSYVGNETVVQFPLRDNLGNILHDDQGNILYTVAPGAVDYEWSQVVGLPTILLDAASLMSNPASLVAQQCGVIRYALNFQIAKLSLLLLSLRSHNVTQSQTAQLRDTESLLDLGSRINGDFETWQAIALLNGIQPPYPGPTNTALAASGKPLFTSGSGILPDPDAQRPTYAANVLGTDYDFGPINGVQPTWLGDIPLITGYLNFARAIGRRLQTPLGSLIYHFDYGCRIPPEVGAVQSIDEAKRLNQYGRSAIFSDPRTGSILRSEATTQPGFLATFSAAIQPVGPGDNPNPVAVNETIGATP